jgi:hypothetical protein
MQIDATAGVYGLVQVVFADLAEHLAIAVFQIRKTHDSSATFEQVFRLQFKNVLDQFKDELKRFRDKQSLREDTEALDAAVRQISTIAQWRHDRIHARIRRVDDGLALYDWRTRKRLTISYDECKEKIDQMIRLIVTLEAHVPQLVHLEEWEKLFNQDWEKLFEQKYDAADQGE